MSRVPTVLGSVLTLLLAGSAAAAPESTSSVVVSMPDDTPLVVTRKPRAAAARAPDDAEPSWALRAEVLTALPVAVGGSLTLEMPGGLRLATALGVLPSGYVDVVNGVSTSSGWYDSYTANLVSTALDDSVSWRTHLAWRPLEDLGFYVAAGYGMLSLSADFGVEDLPPDLRGDVPTGAEGIRVGVATKVHMADFEVGWEVDLAPHWMLRFAVGAALTVGSDTTVEAAAVPAKYADWVDKARTLTEERLDKLFPRVLHLPTISVALGARLF